MSQEFWVDFEQEIHCDECQEIVHFHFEDECPACHKKRAGTDQHCSVLQCFEEGGLFSCQACNAKFQILQYEYAADTEKDALIRKI